MKAFDETFAQRSEEVRVGGLCRPRKMSTSSIIQKTRGKHMLGVQEKQKNWGWRRRGRESKGRVKDDGTGELLVTMAIVRSHETR